MKTAVEWLILEMNKTGFIFDEIDIEIINEAKEMEKQQLMDSFTVGNRNEKYQFETAEQYYNETFKKQ